MGIEKTESDGSASDDAHEEAVAEEETPEEEAEKSSEVTKTGKMDNDAEDDKSISAQEDEEDDEEEGSKSVLTLDDVSQHSPKANREGEETPVSKKKKKGIPPSSRRGRAPAVKGLTIPFRTVKKAMKLDPDIPIVQNEAAIMTTLAAELFLKTLAKDSHTIAKSRGRNTIRYEDVAEARSNDSAMAFLETLLP
eukprot:scaffold993_cov110-Cylindrotheca_fusiformis.AAC.7